LFDKEVIVDAGSIELWKAYYSHYKSFGRIIMTQLMQLMVLVD